MWPAVFGLFRGRAQGRAQGRRNAPQTLGGVGHNQRGGWGTPRLHVPPWLFGFFVLDRTTRTAPAERGKTGATPPFPPLARFAVWGGVAPGGAPGGAHTLQPCGGSLPSQFILAGRLPGPRAGRTIRPVEPRDV